MLPLLWGVALGQLYNPGMPAGGASMYHTGLGSRPMTSAFGPGGMVGVSIPFGAQRGELYSPIQRIIPAEYAGNGFRGALRAGARIWAQDDHVFSSWIPPVVCPLSPPDRPPRVRVPVQWTSDALSGWMPHRTHILALAGDGRRDVLPARGAAVPRAHHVHHHARDARARVGLLRGGPLRLRCPPPRAPTARRTPPS